MEPGSLTLPHLDDGDLLCLLDGEADSASRVDAAAHLASCAGCRQRMDRYRTRRERLAQLLVRTDFPVPVAASPASPSPAPAAADDAKVIPLRPRPSAQPRRFAGRPWLRAAAVVLVLLGAAVIATPARAWIADWVSRQWARVAHGGPPTPPRPRVVQTPDAPPQASAQVRFVPAGSELRIEVAHPQASGSLTLMRTDDSAASAEVMGTHAVELLVVPSGLRIRNTAATAADYRIQVPDGVRRVRVRIGAREIVVARADIGPNGRMIALTGN